MAEPGRVRAWLFDQALPFWADAGVDHAHGGLIERVDLAGRPDGKAAKRMRVQARQIYSFCHAAEMGWSGDAKGVALQGYRFLTARYWREDGGGFLFAVSADGAPTDERRELYEQAFALLAFAWLIRTGFAPDAGVWSARTLAFLDESLADHTHGGYFEGAPAPSPAPSPATTPRRQNPHMHLLEAMLALHGATGEPEYLRRARALVDLFRTRFFDAETGTLGEFFEADWRPARALRGNLPAGHAVPAGEIVEPGHHFEWVWLLDQYRRASGEDVSDLANRLYAFAERHGVDPEDGLAYDALSRDGRVLDDNKRLWVQTEALKAQLVRVERTGDGHAEARAHQIIDGIFRYYLAGAGGWWQDHLRRDRTGFAQTAPASTFYHLLLAFAESLRVLKDKA